jgi:hypothetical protein
MDNLPSSSQSSNPFLLCDASLFAGLSGCGQREPLVAAAAVADPSKGQVADDKGGFLIGVLSGVMLRASGEVASSTPLAAGGFECGSGGGVAARFGGEVAATPRHR